MTSEPLELWLGRVHLDPRISVFSVTDLSSMIDNCILVYAYCIIGETIEHRLKTNPDNEAINALRTTPRMQLAQNKMKSEKTVMSLEGFIFLHVYRVGYLSRKRKSILDTCLSKNGR